MFPQDLTTEVVKTAVQLAVENAFKYGIPATKRMLEQARKANNNGKSPALALKGNLVNREPALRAIQDALDARNTTRVIFFYGSGGAGKTRLLEEACKIAKANSSLRWSGIFDLYHTDLHNILYLQSAIIEDLDPGNHYFSKYREAKKFFESKRSAGIFSAPSEAVVQSEIARLNQSFIEEFNQCTSKRRTVLAFDTLENVGEEQDLIQRAFRLGEERREILSARQWLLDLCKEAKNTVILLAGRPNEKWESDLKGIKLPNGELVDPIPVEGLNQPDTRNLLKIYTQKAPRPLTDYLNQNAVMIWRTTRGLPVHVALLVELFLQNREILDADKGRKNEPELEKGVIREFFDSDNPERRHFYFLALARKGLTPNLLHFLESNWAESECSKRLDDAERSTLTKKRHGENALFLHDALYQLFDNFAPYEESEKTYWFQRLREYYLQSSNKKNWVNLLYYDLRSDFLRAFYQTFIRYSEIAIKGEELELDSQLRNEVLIYLRNDYEHMTRKEADLESVFIQDSATRWIKRLISQTNYKGAKELAEIFLSPENLLTVPALLAIPENDRAKLKTFMVSAPPIVWASLFTYYGEALTYLKEKSEEEVETLFYRAIELLENPSFGQDDPRWWFRNRLLGRAYDRLGYLARANGHYHKAAEYYRKALPFYKDTEIVDEYAFTQNNLAFVLALLGDMPGAKTAVEEALDRRLEIGQRYPLALSYNTRGLIRTLDNPSGLDGERDCKKALRDFEKIETPRGIGLACNALGFILRKRGEGWILGRCTPEQAKQWYAEAEKYFEQAKEIFKDGETIRLWEALNELGSLNRDWACLLKSLQDEENAKNRFSQASDYQEQALKLAQESNMRFQQVDTLDDIAELYLDRGSFEQARENLENGRALIPPEFNLTDTKNESRPGEVYWFSLAKIQRREGMMKIRMARQNAPHDMLQVVDGIRCLLSSFVYIRLYSDLPNYLEQKAQEITAILKELDIPGELVSDAFRQIAGEYGFDLSALRSALSKGYTYEKFS